MAVGARASRRTPPTIDSDALVVAATNSPRLASELEELAQDSLEAMKAMLEHGSTEERIMVFKALSPVIVKLNAAQSEQGGELDAASKAREMLAGHWEGLG